MSTPPSVNGTSAAICVSAPRDSLNEATKIPQIVVPPDSSSSFDDGDVGGVDVTVKGIGSLSLDPDHPPPPAPPPVVAAAAIVAAAKKEKDVPFPKVGVRFSVFVQFIMDNGGYDRFRDMTTTQVSDSVLKVVTKTRQCSYCELLQFEKEDPGVGKAEVFISHAWKYKFLDVVSALENHFKDKPDTFIWFDLFSNNQHLAADLPFEWWTNTFQSAIQEFGRTVMVLAPWNDPVPFTRAWCLFEIFITVITDSKFEVAMCESERDSFIRTICSDHRVFYKMLADIDVHKSEAWNPDDLASIKEVAEREVGLDQLNLIVKGKMREWVETTLKNATEQSDGSHHVYNEEELDRMMALASI